MLYLPVAVGFTFFINYLEWLPSLPGAGLGLLLRLALDPLSESEPESVSAKTKDYIRAYLHENWHYKSSKRTILCF